MLKKVMFKLSRTLQDTYLITVISKLKWWLGNGWRTPPDINYCIIMFWILTGKRAIGPVGKNFCHATRFSVIWEWKCCLRTDNHQSSSSLQFWFGFIPVNGDGRIYPSSNLSNTHSPSHSIHGNPKCKCKVPMQGPRDHARQEKNYCKQPVHELDCP